MKLPGAFTQNDLINVIIETPRGSRNKFVYDEELDAFRLRKVLPGGTFFPVDMGFVPMTKSEDGDPLDVFVLMEGYTYPGCVVECRVIGIIEIEQSRKGDPPHRLFRNDRLLAVPVVSNDHANLAEIKEVSTDKLNDLLNFCRYYNEMEGMNFSVINIKESRAAIEAIYQRITTYHSS